MHSLLMLLYAQYRIQPLSRSSSDAWVSSQHHTSLFQFSLHYSEHWCAGK